jgi:hypothetical protein
MIATMDPRTKDRYEFVPQAILNRSPAFFGTKGLCFRTEIDDLNEYQIAELAIDDNLPFALMHHKGTPADETEVYLPDVIPPAEVRRQSGAF